MKVLKVFLATMFATGILVPVSASPALAADSYGGSGTPFSISTYNSYRTGFLPSPPSSTPSTSTITGVNYNFDWNSRGYSRGSMDALLCSSPSNCTSINQYGSSTAFFNGMPADTSLYFRAAWSDFFLSGSLPGGPVSITTGITVNYS